MIRLLCTGCMIDVVCLLNEYVIRSSMIIILTKYRVIVASMSSRRHAPSKPTVAVAVICQLRAVM